MCNANDKSVKEKNMRNLLVPKFQKLSGNLGGGGQKVIWSRTFISYNLYRTAMFRVMLTEKFFKIFFIQFQVTAREYLQE